MNGFNRYVLMVFWAKTRKMRQLLNMSKKNTKRRILASLQEKAPLSTNKGKIENTPKRKPTPKQRRHQAWKSPWVFPGGMKYSEIHKEALGPSDFYDDWSDWRDSFRDNSDNTHIYKKRGIFWRDEEEIKKRNKKLKKQEKIKETMRGRKK